MLTVVVLILFLLDNKIEFYEAVILVCLWPLYLIMNCLFFNSNESESESSYQIEKSDIENENQENE